MGRGSGGKGANAGGLSDMEARFAVLYVKGGCADATRAAIDAGYSPNGANRQASVILARPRVRARVDQLQADFAAKAGLTVETVLARLASIVDKATDPDADPKRYTGRDAVQALSQIAQILGYTDRAKVEGDRERNAIAAERLAIERERNDLLGKAQQVIVQIPGVARPGLDAGTVVQAGPDDYTVDSGQPDGHCGQDCGQTDNA